MVFTSSAILANDTLKKHVQCVVELCLVGKDRLECLEHTEQEEVVAPLEHIAGHSLSPE
jgi:hypothetical protein